MTEKRIEPAPTEPTFEELRRRDETRRRFANPRYRHDAVGASYGRDCVDRLFFDTNRPSVRGWAVCGGSEVFLYPARSGGVVSVEGSEIVVRG